MDHNPIIKVKPNTMKVHEENIEEDFCGLGLDKDFSDTTQKCDTQKTKVIKQDFIKITNVYYC